jgi:hypothetical protein
MRTLFFSLRPLFWSKNVLVAGIRSTALHSGGGVCSASLAPGFEHHLQGNDEIDKSPSSKHNGTSQVPLTLTHGSRQSLISSIKKRQTYPSWKPLQVVACGMAARTEISLKLFVYSKGLMETRLQTTSYIRVRSSCTFRDNKLPWCGCSFAYHSPIPGSSQYTWWYDLPSSKAMVHSIEMTLDPYIESCCCEDGDLYTCGTKTILTEPAGDARITTKLAIGHLSSALRSVCLLQLNHLNICLLPCT